MLPCCFFQLPRVLFLVFSQKKYQNVRIDIVVQWGEGFVSMCNAEGSNRSQCMKRRVSARSTKFLNSFNVRVCLYTMPWRFLRWDADRFPIIPSSSSIHPSSPRLVSLLLSDIHLHAHPREATLATTRSLEERRRTGVRILIYIRGFLHSSTVLRHYPANTSPAHTIFHL